jgi:uncharacterized protein (DUF433 family)
MSQHVTAAGQGITSKPDVMGGKACVAGTRITVEIILRRFAEDYSIADLLADYPILTEQDVRNALAYGAALAARPTLEVA